ncbi:unnamed protein product [Paramecium sonneborni]|uniref:Uncharacterized protein n=1 Tax=Paramecium sonneborni TaxID=65129 RepID=A0A8S1RTS9_9CILI|nr:unnamed protein product [Paramecium sonneborni]
MVIIVGLALLSLFEIICLLYFRQSRQVQANPNYAIIYLQHKYVNVKAVNFLEFINYS